MANRAEKKDTLVGGIGRPLVQNIHIEMNRLVSHDAESIQRLTQPYA